MKKLLNTLYVTSENGYLGLEGETIVIYDEQKWDGFHCIIWMELYLLVIGELVRR